MENTAKIIFIMGYMASGKTTFGRALARSMGWDFIDLDFYIEQRFRKSVREIFAAEGEEGFRRKEMAMLREAGEFENVIVSCGGGTPCFFDNMDFMLSKGLTVFLDTEPECIVNRLVINNSRRPLMAGKSAEQIRLDVAKGLEARNPHYSRAAIRFSGNRLEDRSQIEESVNEFKQMLCDKNIL
ncbi:MAG: shikimate kinase [Bacteroides sp.]|nr:shikimate kinase [Bacteroides sp.]MDE6258266.1 shikimate kinase [Muribaculaceae bacterium]